MGDRRNGGGGGGERGGQQGHLFICHPTTPYTSLHLYFCHPDCPIPYVSPAHLYLSLRPDRLPPWSRQPASQWFSGSMPDDGDYVLTAHGWQQRNRFEVLDEVLRPASLLPGCPLTLERQQEWLTQRGGYQGWRAAPTRPHSPVVGGGGWLLSGCKWDDGDGGRGIILGVTS